MALSTDQLNRLIAFYQAQLDFLIAHPPASPPVQVFAADEATPPEVVAIINYYVNLLIIQYHNKPKAQATIYALAKELLANGILLAIENAYALGAIGQLEYDNALEYDTGLEYGQAPEVGAAVGVQLDVLGKYAGVDRFYRELNLINFFACTTYSEVDPDADPKFGFTDYADFDGDNHNGTLTYDSIISQNNRLIDDLFRTVILVKIFQNYSNHSHQSIENGIFAFFNGAIWPESVGNMEMFYFVTADLTPVIKAVLYKKILPRPMAVGLRIVNGVTGPMFGFIDYGLYESPHAYGFSDYSDYDSLAGQDLVYDQISEG